MKVAVSTQGKDLSGFVDARFGRTTGFIVYDLDSRNYDYLPNTQNLSLAQGAGIQTAQNVAKSKVGAVITGHVGPKAYRALNKGGIEMYLLPENLSGANVQQVIDAYKQGKLEKAAGPDREGHW